MKCSNLQKKIIFTSMLIFFLSLVTANFAVAYSGTNAYSIKKHQSEKGITRSAILIYSIPENNNALFNDYIENIENLVKVLESHWNVDIQVKSYEEAKKMDINSYPYHIYVELKDESEAIDYFSRTMKNTDAKTLWIGRGINQVFSKKLSNEIEDYQSVSHAVYKGVNFDINQSFSVYGALPENSEDFEVLATFVKKDGAVMPLAGIYNKKNILIPFEMPYSYDVSSYSLPFLDIFHNLFGHHEQNEKKQALLRLEDVNAYTYKDPEKLILAYEYLKSKRMPFQIALIERYLDPKKGIDSDAGSSKKFLNTIKQIIRKGDGFLVQHGYTHQTGNGISGYDYEFWDPVSNAPVSNDSAEFAQQKISDVRKSMGKAGLPELDIWETPHYAQSDIDNDVFNNVYPIRYERIPHIGSLPFAANIDGTVFLPENIGYIDTDINELKEKEILIKQLNTFEDPVASAFWHPWRDIDELKMYTNLIEKGGFEFVSAYDLLENGEKKSIPQSPLIIGRSISSDDLILYLLFILFSGGAILYVKNVLKVKKYLKMIHKYKISLKDLKDYAKLKNTSLPKLGIFIPARNEGLVIANTLKKISEIDYPKSKFKVYVITDERELDDNVKKTTKEVAQLIISKLHLEFGKQFIEIIEVPKWYSGILGDDTKSFSKSTKGRALNYCLQKIQSEKLDMIGVLDADGRLHPDVLKEVAMKRLKWKSKILQGPVFQVNNFKNVSILGMAAGLELALHHLTELPSRLMKKNTLQFLAGTNYFIDKASIIKSGGWDQNALVEDAELALRLYLTDGIVGDWLNSPELEQTPANFAVYRKQRERWVRGHIDLIKQIHRAPLPFSSKLYFYNKIFLSQFRFIFDIGLPILSIYFMFSGAFIYLDPIFSFLSVVLFITSFFIWDTYGFMYRRLSKYINSDPNTGNNIFQSAKLFLFLPVFIVAQAIPRIEAICNSVFRPSKNAWYKTERTVEMAVEV